MSEVDEATLQKYNELVDSFDPDCCYMCLQIYGQIDRDLDDAETEIVWQHTKKTDDGPRREGHVCRGCFSTKRKYERDTRQEVLVVTIHTVPAKKVQWNDQRRARVRGEDKYLRRPSVNTVEGKRGKYDEAFKTGTFEELMPFLKREMPHLSFKSLKEAAEFAQTTLKLTLTKSKFTGEVGVEVFDQEPSAYKIKRGLKDSVTEVNITELDDTEFSTDVVNQEMKSMEFKQLNPEDFGPAGNPLHRLRGKTAIPPKHVGTKSEDSDTKLFDDLEPPGNRRASPFQKSRSPPAGSTASSKRSKRFSRSRSPAVTSVASVKRGDAAAHSPPRPRKSKSSPRPGSITAASTCTGGKSDGEESVDDDDEPAETEDSDGCWLVRKIHQQQSVH